MPKANLTLYVDSDLKNIAINKGINLSQEFEEWLRIRLDKSFDNNNTILEMKEYDRKYAELQLQLSELEKQKEMKIQRDQADKEQLMIIDSVIDNMLEFKDNLIDISELRVRGLIFLFNKKLHKTISLEQSHAMLQARIKERNLCPT